MTLISDEECVKLVRTLESQNPEAIKSFRRLVKNGAARSDLVDYLFRRDRRTDRPLKEGEYLLRMKKARRPTAKEVAELLGDVPEELTGNVSFQEEGSTNHRDRICLLKEFGINLQGSLSICDLGEWGKDLGLRCATLAESLAVFMEHPEIESLVAPGTWFEFELKEDEQEPFRREKGTKIECVAEFVRGSGKNLHMQGVYADDILEKVSAPCLMVYL